MIISFSSPTHEEWDVSEVLSEPNNSTENQKRREYDNAPATNAVRATKSDGAMLYIIDRNTIALSRSKCACNVSVKKQRELSVIIT